MKKISILSLSLFFLFGTALAEPLNTEWMLDSTVSEPTSDILKSPIKPGDIFSPEEFNTFAKTLESISNDNTNKYIGINLSDDPTQALDIDGEVTLQGLGKGSLCADDNGILTDCGDLGILTCDDNKILKWDNTIAPSGDWTCSDDDTGSGGKIPTCSDDNILIRKGNPLAWECTAFADAFYSCTTDGQVLKWNVLTESWSCGTDNDKKFTDDLDTSTCTDGDLLKRNDANTAWECTKDDDTILYDGNCGSDEILKVDANGDWACEEDLTASGSFVCRDDEILIRKKDGNDLVWKCLGIQDTLTPTCTEDGKIRKWNNGAWECLDDENTTLESGLTCVEGDILKWNGDSSGSWQCKPDDNTTISNTFTACDDGDILKWNVGGSGEWDCKPDDDNTLNDTNACIEKNQVLKWNGSTWGCLSDSLGMVEFPQAKQDLCANGNTVELLNGVWVCATNEPDDDWKVHEGDDNMHALPTGNIGIGFDIPPNDIDPIEIPTHKLTVLGNAYISESLAIGANLGPKGALSTAADDKSAMAIGGGVASGKRSLSVGKGSGTGDDAYAFGPDSKSYSKGSIAGGKSSEAKGEASIALGYKALSFTPGSIALGHTNTISGYTGDSLPGKGSIALGNQARVGSDIESSLDGNNQETKAMATSIGSKTTASSNYAHAFGNDSTASGTKSFAIGNDSTASGIKSFALGNDLTASGTKSFALGNNNTADGDTAFTLGNNLTSSGNNSLVIGNGGTASGSSSIMIGNSSVDNTKGTSILLSNSDQDLFIRNDGKIGIGNNTPLNELHIEGGTDKRVRIEDLGKVDKNHICRDTDGVLGICAEVDTDWTELEKKPDGTSNSGSDDYGIFHAFGSVAIGLEPQSDTDFLIGGSEPDYADVYENSETMNRSGTIYMQGYSPVLGIKHTGKDVNGDDSFNGDALFRLENTNSAFWRMGIDGSDEGKFKLNTDTDSLDVDPVITITQPTTSPNKPGMVGINRDNPMRTLDIEGEMQVRDIKSFNNYDKGYRNGTRDTLKDKRTIIGANGKSDDDTNFGALKSWQCAEGEMLKQLNDDDKKWRCTNDDIGKFCAKTAEVVYYEVTASPGGKISLMCGDPPRFECNSLDVDTYTSVPISTTVPVGFKQYTQKRQGESCD